MESIKSIIQALAGEDIVEDNLDRVGLLAAALQEALTDHRKAQALRHAAVTVLMPEAFNNNLPTHETGITAALKTPQITEPIDAAKPRVQSFGVPRPPVVVKVEEPVSTPSLVQEYTDEQEKVPAPLHQNNYEQPLAEAYPGEATTVQAEAESGDAEHPEPFTTLPETEPPQPVSYVAPMDEENVDDEAPLQFELSLDEEMLAEMEEPEIKGVSDIEAMPASVDAPAHQWEEEEETTPVATGHAAYLPASMRIDALDELLVLDKVKPVVKQSEPAPVETAEAKELNERLQTRQRELAEVLQEPKLADLKKGISINDRYQYVQNLFRGDEAMFDRSIKTLNSFKILPEAQYWMQRELVVKLGWNDEDELVQQFYGLISRRFR